MGPARYPLAKQLHKSKFKKLKAPKSSSSELRKDELSKSQKLPAQLKWRSIKTSVFAGMDEGGGMMMLEELDDVDVDWQEDEEGRKVARFVVSWVLLTLDFLLSGLGYGAKEE